MTRAMSAPRWLVGASVIAALSAPTEASAYLIDLNDARVVDPGSIELEIQPIGYYQLLIGEEERQIIAPSLSIYLGIAEGWDLFVFSRGYGLLEPAPDQGAYRIADQMIGMRTMLVRGSYSDAGMEGPSLTLQFGVLIPGIYADDGFGSNIALLFAQSWDALTIHLNAWLTLRRDRFFEGFFSAMIEGPYAWAVRPVFEVWLDVIEGGDPTISALLGAVLPIGEDFALEAGVRMGGWTSWLDLEIRTAFCWRWPGLAAPES
jgi:hypothetical protein